MGASILVVDDEPGIRDAFELVLGSAYALRMASTAEEALATPPQVAADVKVIFLDGVFGAGLTGDQALPQFRRQFPQASIVYIGALGSLDAPALRAAGVSVVLPKPWKVNDLRTAAAMGLAVHGD
jgi:DNA-binding NtrC family response regulator